MISEEKILNYIGIESPGHIAFLKRAAIDWAIEEIKKQNCGNCNHYRDHLFNFGSFCNLFEYYMEADSQDKKFADQMKCDDWAAK